MAAATAAAAARRSAAAARRSGRARAHCRDVAFTSRLSSSHSGGALSSHCNSTVTRLRMRACVVGCVDVWMHGCGGEWTRNCVLCVSPPDSHTACPIVCPPPGKRGKPLLLTAIQQALPHVQPLTWAAPMAARQPGAGRK
eukprot:1139492-Pelagomonas_calceolata.AAC.2